MDLQQFLHFISIKIGTASGSFERKLELSSSFSSFSIFSCCEAKSTCCDRKPEQERDMKEDEKGPGSLQQDAELEWWIFLHLHSRPDLTITHFPGLLILLNDSHLKEPMGEMSQTLPGYSKLTNCRLYKLCHILLLVKQSI